MSPRPQILLVPTWTELHWTIKPQLEEWADVASYDPPGVGVEPPAEGPLPEAIVARGVAEIERRDWNRCIVVGDDLGAVFAALIATAQRPRVVGLALGHACLEHRPDGERPTVNPEVADMSRRLIELDFRSFIRQDVAAWDPRPEHRIESADELVDQMVARVPPDFALKLLDELEAGIEDAGGSLEPFLRALDLPLLFAHHEGCIIFTPHGFGDAVAAFPEAATVSSHTSPCLSAEFAAALKRFADG